MCARPAPTSQAVRQAERAAGGGHAVPGHAGGAAQPPGLALPGPVHWHQDPPEVRSPALPPGERPLQLLPYLQDSSGHTIQVPLLPPRLFELDAAHQPRIKLTPQCPPACPPAPSPRGCQLSSVPGLHLGRGRSLEEGLAAAARKVETPAPVVSQLPPTGGRPRPSTPPTCRTPAASTSRERPLPRSLTLALVIQWQLFPDAQECPRPWSLALAMMIRWQLFLDLW